MKNLVKRRQVNGKLQNTFYFHLKRFTSNDAFCRFSSTFFSSLYFTFSSLSLVGLVQALAHFQFEVTAALTLTDPTSNYKAVTAAFLFGQDILESVGQESFTWVTWVAIKKKTKKKKEK